MRFKSPRVLVIFSLLVLASVPAIFVASCSKGGISGGSRASLCSAKTSAACTPSSAITPITSCVVDAQNDVVIASATDTAAKPGCATVEMAPSPTSFGTIAVLSGGTLLITGQQGGSSSTASGPSGGSTAPAPMSQTTSATQTTQTLRQICIDGGTVDFGTKPHPITSSNKIVMEFLGNQNYTPIGKGFTECAKDKFRKGIEVLAGGTLEMYGAKGVPSRGGVSWTTLAAPAGSQVPGAKVKSLGDKKLYLTADVTKGPEGWQKGDWIVVATTNFVPFDTEFVQIASVKSGGVNNAGSTVTLEQPLKYYHFGSPPPSPATASCQDPLAATHPSAPATQPEFLCDGSHRNYGVDERAEVGLISRDITLTAKTAPPPTTAPWVSTTDHWGGEIKIVQGFKKVAIQGVRLSKFGKDQLGSYPIHFHEVGNIGHLPNPHGQSVLVDADSVDHSYNKCVTIHETSNLTVSNMVCARIVGHIFYEELGDASKTFNADSNITFENDLGLGAMSNSFDIYAANVQPGAPPVSIPAGTYSRQDMINKFWWAGDYCAADKTCIGANGYDGFNVPDTDNQKQQVRGGCYLYNPTGQLVFQQYPYDPKNPSTNQRCSKVNPDFHYIEPASGFWIQNPGTNLIGDAIGGCQGVGSGFWWVPPANPIGTGTSLAFEKMGKIENDRAHACYNGFFNDGTPGNLNNVHAGLYPHKGSIQDSPPIIATLDGVTATRNRFRGLWLRTTWFVVKDGHFATNRDNVSLLTSGGIDGNAPGAWNLLEDSAIVGLSRNNPGRWGPCPSNVPLAPNASGTMGQQYGCIDYSRTPTGSSTDQHSGEIFDNGYQVPKWNSAGYYLYDGPALLFHDRFVNFNHNQGWYKYWKNNGQAYPCRKGSTPSPGAYYNELDDADCDFIRTNDTSNVFNSYGKASPAPYEGDAALGWFNSNQNSYPTGTASKQLMFVNTNLRHQVFTEYVGLGGLFNDGDKNTSIIDEDGTLDGFSVKPGSYLGKNPNPVYPISLNNLPFNGTSNSVDECLSRGAQDQRYEGRTSALMSPASMGTLQVSSLYPYLQDKVANTPGDYPGNNPNSHWQTMTFTRTDLVPGYAPSATSTSPPSTMFHPTMVMQTGRGGLGSYEPKVSNGYGYYVTVAPTPATVAPLYTAPHPGNNTGTAGLWQWIDITLADVVDPNITKAHPFYVRLGIDYKNIKETNGPPPDASYFTVKRGYKSYFGQSAWENDPQLKNYWTGLDCNNLDAVHPANVPVGTKKGTCPAASGTSAVMALSAATDIGGLTANGKPVLDKYYYNPKTGYLWLNIVQDEPNPSGPSPTGSCVSGSAYDGGKPNPACPDSKTNPESYYACPKNGCMDYTIAVSDPNYTPGPSTGQPSQADITAMAPPPTTAQNQLVLYGHQTIVQRQIHPDTTPQKVPFYKATNAPACKTTQPPQKINP